MLFLLLTVYFSSCSDIKELKKMEDEDTLRSLSSQIEKEIPWTAQIEPEVLTRNIKTSEGILKSIVLTPVVIASGGNEGAVELYRTG